MLCVSAKTSFVLPHIVLLVFLAWKTRKRLLIHGWVFSCLPCSIHWPPKCDISYLFLSRSRSKLSFLVLSCFCPHQRVCYCSLVPPTLFLLFFSFAALPFLLTPPVSLSLCLISEHYYRVHFQGPCLPTRSHWPACTQSDTVWAR